MDSVSFTVEERKNCFTPHGREWAFNVSFGEDKWTVYCWDKKPSEEEIVSAQKLVVRSFEIYHNNIRIPPFFMEIINGR